MVLKMTEGSHIDHEHWVYKLANNHFGLRKIWGYSMALQVSRQDS